MHADWGSFHLDDDGISVQTVTVLTTRASAEGRKHPRTGHHFPGTRRGLDTPPHVRTSFPKIVQVFPPSLDYAPSLKILLNMSCDITDLVHERTENAQPVSLYSLSLDTDLALKHSRTL